MAKDNDWWTCPTQSDEGFTIWVSGRRDISKFKSNPRFKIRVEITWQYAAEICDAMPDNDTATTMEKVTDAINAELKKDPIAVMTGIYTGAGSRNWIFYTVSTNIFTKKLNNALASLPLLPLTIYAENDPEWLEYEEMREATELFIDEAASDN